MRGTINVCIKEFAFDSARSSVFPFFICLKSETFLPFFLKFYFLCSERFRIIGPISRLEIHFSLVIYNFLVNNLTVTRHIKSHIELQPENTSSRGDKRST
jgi:hypothetical protein